MQQGHMAEPPQHPRPPNALNIDYKFSQVQIYFQLPWQMLVTQGQSGVVWTGEGACICILLPKLQLQQLAQDNTALKTQGPCEDSHR